VSAIVQMFPAQVISDAITVYRGEQRTPEWFALRAGRPTASCFDAVMAKGRTAGTEATTRRNYRVKCALELVTGTPAEEGYSNWAMKQGTEREPVAAMLYEIQTGVDLEHVCFILANGLGAGCSPDGLVGTDGLVEIKCPLEATHLEYLDLNGKAPSEYKWQVQGSLLITGRQYVEFISYCPTFPASLQLHVTRVYRNEEMIDELRAGLRQFIMEVDSTAASIRDMAQKRAA
jgi:putative phage-type endonuclease